MEADAKCATCSSLTVAVSAALHYVSIFHLSRLAVWMCLPQAHSCTQTDREPALQTQRWDYSTVSVYILKGEGCEGVAEQQLCLHAHCTRPSGGYLATTSRCSFMRQSFDLCSVPAIYFLSTLPLQSSSQSTPHPRLVPLLQNNQPRTPRHHSLVHSLFQLLDLWQIQRNIENPYWGQTESWGVVNL